MKSIYFILYLSSFSCLKDRSFKYGKIDIEYYNEEQGSG